MLPLSDLGRYSIATLAVSGLYLLTVPTFNVVYPRLTALVSGGQEESFVDVYRHWSRLYSLVMFPCAMLLAVFAGDLLHLWTGNAELSVAIAPVVSLLAVGAALHGTMYFPYALALANGDTRLPFGINVTLLVIAIPLMALLTWRFGIYGAGLAGLLLYSTYFLVGSWATHRKLARSIVALWPARDILPSMGSCLVTGSIGSWLVHRSDLGATASVLLAALMTLTSWGLALLLMPRGVPAQLRATLAIRGG